MIMYAAHSLDMHSELMLDEYMCSDVCPCYYDPTRVPNPKEEYNQLTEAFLHEYGRTKMSSIGDLTGLVFTDDKERGFKTFK